MARNEIICGDCMSVLKTLGRASLVFMDPPDNLGVEYDGFTDRWPTESSYIHWLCCVVEEAFPHADTLWVSYNAKWDFDFTGELRYTISTLRFMTAEKRKIIWRYTFGQHNKHDCASGYRPMLRIRQPESPLYPDGILVESQRQRNGDKRANPAGRVPDDVWEFPRVCGNFPEKRKWHKNQHPEALIERTVKLCTKPGDTVFDLFAGSGTVNRVCKRLERDVIGIEIGRVYCQKIVEETGAELVELCDACTS